MAKLPAQPARPLPPLRSEDLTVLRRGTRLVRVYRVEPHRSAWNAFRHHGPARRSRFDHHPLPVGLHPETGILYAGGDATTAILEAFQETMTIHRTRQQPWIVIFGLRRQLKLLSLAGSWPTRAGASQALVSADDPAATQAWARAIHADYPGLAGILYPSTMRGRPGERRPSGVAAELFGQNVALFERAGPALPERPRFHQRLDHPGLTGVLAEIAIAYDYDII